MTRARDLADWGDQVPNAETAWTSYTPTVTNLTVGNSTVSARYKQIGKTVFVTMKLNLGSTASVGSLANFSLPVNNATTAYNSGLSFYEDSGTAVYSGFVQMDTNIAYFTILNASGTYTTRAYLSSTVPFTWTTNDNINVQFYYEAA